MTLIYATKPELQALKLVRDASDAEGEVSRYLIAAEARRTAAVERAEATGGPVSDLAVQRWRSAKWVEVELELD